MVSVKDSDQKRIVGVVFKALLIDLFAFTIILPLFPRLLNYYQSEEIGHQVNRSMCICWRKHVFILDSYGRKPFLDMLFKF
jgi:hypothetical protein